MNEIFNAFVSTTVVEQTNQIDAQRRLPSPKLGERKIDDEAGRITLLPAQLSGAFLFALAVKDAAIQKALPITTTMTSLLWLLGFASLATNSGTKNYL